MSQADLDKHLNAFEKKPWWGHLHNASLAAQRLGDWEQAETLQWQAWNMDHVEQAGIRWQHVLRKRGKNNAAIVFLEDMVRRFGEDKAVLHNALMLSYSAEGQHEKALKHGRRSVELDREQYGAQLSSVWWTYALVLAERGELATGLSLMQETVRAAPTDVNTLLRAANFSYYQCRDFANAEQMYREALETHPGNLWIQSNLASLLREKGAYSEAVPMLAECFEAAPTNAFRLGAYCDALIETGQWCQAETVAFRYIESAGNPGSGFFVLGQIYRQLRRPDDAIMAFRTSLAFSASSTQEHRWLAKVAILQGDYDTARAELNCGLARDPTCTQCQVGLIELALATGAVGHARERVDELVRTRPYDRHAWLLDAQVSLREGRYDRGVALLTRVLEADPVHAQASFVLGEALLAHGDVNKAIERLEVALTYNLESRSDRYEALEAAYRAAGNTTRADELAHARDELEAAMERHRGDVSGFSAVPVREVPAAPSEVVVQPVEGPSERGAAALIDAATMLMEQVRVDLNHQDILEWLAPGLSFVRMKRVIAELKALDPKSFYGPPMRLDTRDLSAAKPLVEELASQLRKLRAAGTKLADKVPSMRAAWVACQTEPLRVFPLCVGLQADPTEFPVVSCCDSAHQFDDFHDALATIAQTFPDAVWIEGWLNDLTELPVSSVPPGLRVAQLSGNQFSEIPPSLLACASLEVLDLRKNPISSVPRAELLERWTRLRYLDVRDTKLTKKQVKALRDALPECFVHAFEQGKQMRCFDIVSAFPQIIFEREVGSVLFAPTVALPSDGFRYVMSAEATFGEHEENVACVLVYQTEGHMGQVWHRNSRGIWMDRTEEAQNVVPAFRVQGGELRFSRPVPAPDPAKEAFRGRFRRQGAAFPEPSSTIVAKWTSLQGGSVGSPQHALDALQSTTGLVVPPELRACLTSAEGTEPFLTAERIAAEWRAWKKIYDEFVAEDLFDSNSYESHNGQTVPAYFVPEWIPFYSTGGGNFLAIDGLPNEKGQMGQIIAFGADEQRIRCVATSLEDFLDQLLEGKDPAQNGW